MRRCIASALVLTAVWTQRLAADGNSWNKIRYAGGTVQAKVNPFDWNTTLTVTSDTIVLVFARRQTVRITPDQVTAISYGQEAHRHVAEMVTLSVVFLNPLPLFGLLHQSKVHFIGIEYQTTDGKAAGILLEADERSHRAILHALKSVTGKPVESPP